MRVVRDGCKRDISSCIDRGVPSHDILYAVYKTTSGITFYCLSAPLQRTSAMSLFLASQTTHRYPASASLGICFSSSGISGSSASSSEISRSASSAAIHPDPALVIACLYFLSCTSPAAKTPLTLVCAVPGIVRMYPSSSVSTWPRTRFVAGSWPIA
jgi:hypothetical protein